MATGKARASWRQLVSMAGGRGAWVPRMDVSGPRNTSGTSGQWKLRSSCSVALGQSTVGGHELKTGRGLGHDPAAGVSFLLVAFEVS